MKVIMVAPQAILGDLIFPGWSIFMDMQANVVELDMQRHLVEQEVPSREGGILQDMGAKSDTIMITGKWIYENEPDDKVIGLIPILGLTNISWNWFRVQMMKAIYRSKAPVILACDLAVTMVMFDRCKFRQVGGEPNVYDYTIVVKELNPLFGVMGSVTLAGLSALYDGEMGR